VRAERNYNADDDLTIILHMTPEDARVLLALSLHIGGSPDGARGVICSRRGSMQNVLEDLGLKYKDIPVRGSTHFNDL
jgi:rRNA maturation endonuclease Nob1